MLTWEPGSIFAGRYEIIKSLGAGGMGAVYLARDASCPDFLVALKVLYPGVIRTQQARRRFRNEILASYRVNHPNIVRAFEYFDEQDFQAYAMEYVDGGDLASHMAQGPMKASQVLNILRQVVAGLQAVHSQGIVHRDLKPENILLTKSGVVKISDFGVARLMGGQGLTQAGALVGTPKYVAPEYIETGECDHRGDLYAIGVIAYEMLSGVSPFKADSGVTLMLERFNISTDQLSCLVPNCPLGLSRVISKSMRVQVEKRYQSAEEFGRDLERVEQGESLESEIKADQMEAGPLSSLWKRKERKSGRPGVFGTERGRKGSRWFWMFGLAALAAIAVWGGIQWRTVARKSISLQSLPQGLYEGFVDGLLGENSRYLFRVWRTEKGVYVLLGKLGCAVSVVDQSGRFNCGALEFEVTVKSMEGNNALGTIKELGWGTMGTYSLRAADVMVEK